MKHMKSHYDLKNEEFEKQFDSCNLDPKLFSHEAHLRMAWIHVTKYGIDNALANIQARLKNNFKGLMKRHYGVDIFNSEKAKKEFISPDLLPFD